LPSYLWAIRFVRVDLFEELPLSDPMAIETISPIVIKKSKKACLD